MGFRNEPLRAASALGWHLGPPSSLHICFCWCIWERTTRGFACVGPRVPKNHEYQEPDAKVEWKMIDLSKGTLSYTPQKNKVKEIDVAIKVNGLYTN